MKVCVKLEYNLLKQREWLVQSLEFRYLSALQVKGYS